MVGPKLAVGFNRAMLQRLLLKADDKAEQIASCPCFSPRFSGLPPFFWRLNTAVKRHYKSLLVCSASEKMNFSSKRVGSHGHFAWRVTRNPGFSCWRRPVLFYPYRLSVLSDSDNW